MDDFDNVTVGQPATRLVPSLALLTTALQQSGNVITLQQALARGIAAHQLRAVANWNERETHNQRRRKARSRLKAQAAALRETARKLEQSNVESYREAA